MQLNQAIQAEQLRLASEYATLGIPVCIWGPESTIRSWLKVFDPRQTFTDIEVLSGNEQKNSLKNFAL